MQRGRSRVCREFQTLKDLLLLAFPQLPTLVLASAAQSLVPYGG